MAIYTYYHRKRGRVLTYNKWRIDKDAMPVRPALIVFQIYEITEVGHGWQML